MITCRRAVYILGYEGQGHKVTLVTLDENAYSAIFLSFIIPSSSNLAGVASQAGDADPSRATGLTSGLQGSVNVHRGTLLLVPQ